jgi:hypothetical protein
MAANKEHAGLVHVAWVGISAKAKTPLADASAAMDRHELAIQSGRYDTAICSRYYCPTCMWLNSGYTQRVLILLRAYHVKVLLHTLQTCFVIPFDPLLLSKSHLQPICK